MKKHIIAGLLLTPLTAGCLISIWPFALTIWVIGRLFNETAEMRNFWATCGVSATIMWWFFVLLVGREWAIPLF